MLGCGSCAVASVVGDPRSFPMYQSSAPVWDIPAATTKRTRTVRRPSLANPARASGTEMMEEARRRVKAPVITRSAPIRSEIRAMNMQRRTRDVYTIFHVEPVSVSDDKLRI